MYYDFAVTVPAGTQANAPVEQALQLEKGIIHRVEVEFPAGCKGYVSLVLMRGGNQAFPKNRDQAFNANGYTIPIDDYYPLTSAPYQLKAVAWAPDAVYNHTITVRIGILPEETLSPLTGLGAQLKKFFKMVGIGG